MPKVWITAKVSGRSGRVREVQALLSSGADLTVLPHELLPELDPELAGSVLVEVADGRIASQPSYWVNIAVEDRGPVRVRAIFASRRNALLSVEAMEKLRIFPDVISGRVVKG